MKYFAFYDSSTVEGRSCPLAAKSKIDYIAQTLVKNGESVEIISASMYSHKHFQGGTTQIAEGITLKKFHAYAHRNFCQKVFAGIHYMFVLFFYLLFCVSRKDTVVVYHSLSYMRIIRWSKFFKRFRLILEVEEIYGDVIKSSKTVKKELKYFKKADAYIFPTQLLHEKINEKGKPYAIIHGTYNVEKQRVDKFDDGRIHCVYAGTFDPRKGGVVAAAAAAQFLDEKYHVHIIGFGSENDTKLLINTIQETSKKTRCKITYDGLLSGEEYIRFLQSCDIGLSTQNPNADFNDTSFPSKVLSYMANGLRVVSVKIKALKTSAVNDLLYYYEGDQPERIAEAIRSIDMNDGYDSRDAIMQLDKNFAEELKELLYENSSEN